MIYLENYLYDGAGWQARAVMCYLQSRVEVILDKTYTGDAWFPFKGKMFINQYQYGREKGYVFSVRYKDKQANYAVYEHCVADCICVVKSNAVTDNSDGWDGKPWSKYDHDKEFGYGEVVKCGEWIENDMRSEIAKWVGEDEKKRLLETIRNAVINHGAYTFNEGEKVFAPTYFGDEQNESIIYVYLEDGEEGEYPYVVVVTHFEEDGEIREDRTNCEEFSNDEIKEIIKLLEID